MKFFHAIKTIKVSTVLAASILFAQPVQAMPVWVEAVSRSHCEYLAIGADWNSAMKQAFVDNNHWMDEIRAAGDLGYRAIAVSVITRCANLNRKAFLARGRSGQTI